MTDHPYLPYLTSRLTPARLAHSLGVMGVMGELAEVYGLERGLAETIGILHDAAKDLPQEQINRLIAEGGITLAHPCEADYVLYLHGPVGAVLVRKELGITEALILDAITAHTFCGDSPYFTHPMVWCLRVADMIEPTRDWSREVLIQPFVEPVRALAYAGQLEEAAYLETSTFIRFLESKGMAVHPAQRRMNRELARGLAL